MAAMLIGYARTSTLEQEAGLEAQTRELQALGCGKVYSEQASSIPPVGRNPRIGRACERAGELASTGI